ncbi:hypothetical protein ACUY2R_11495 [Corynebacterium mastitidis]
MDLASVPEPEPPAEKLAHLGQPSEHSPEQASVAEQALAGEVEPGVSHAEVAADTDNADGGDDAGAPGQEEPDGGNGQQEEVSRTGGARKAGTW